ncbi:ABC transporter substrate-binding protein [Caldimonas sp. KR1-144]|uniref:ABC transporter substrate-binding protein n=1 Tax=Caldimonas sp. KR1-144 TaxID=3400911 RepID=UPI003C11C007
MAVPLLHAADRTLRWSTAGDVLTFDFHAAADSFSQNIAGQIYEHLVRRGKDTNFEPALAQSWEVRDPLHWRFRLRQGVRFQDGTPLTADDVVFSVLRSQHPNASNRALTTRLGRPRKIDDLTVEFELDAPNPVLLEHLLSAAIMSRAWCEKHGVARPQSYAEREETFAVRNAMGTGAFMLKRYEPGVRTVLIRNPNYWDKTVDGNVEEVVYRPIASGPTRIAALLSGELDLVQDPPPQDIDRLRAHKGVKIVEGVEWRVIHLGFDQQRDELLYSSVKGRNPFKDRRVRLAFYRAIDVEALRSKVMRGSAMPAGSIAFAAGPGGPDTEARYPYDPALARQLLAEAGYAQGFEVRLDCPNNRYVNDEKICIAVSAMLAKVGIRAPVHAEPMVTYSPRTDKRDVSFFLLGIGGAGRDPQTSLTLVAHSENAASGDGRFNTGRFADAEVDRLIDAIKTEMDAAKRNAMIRSAFLKLHEGAYLIPLHRQMLPWAMREGVQVVHTPWNAVNLRWVRMD